MTDLIENSELAETYKNEEESFREFHQTHHRQLVLLTFMRVRNIATAEIIANKTLLEAWKEAPPRNIARHLAHALYNHSIFTIIT